MKLTRKQFQEYVISEAKRIMAENYGTILVYGKGGVEEIPGRFKKGDRVITYKLPKEVNGVQNPFYEKEGVVVDDSGDPEDIRVTFANITDEYGEGFSSKNLIKLPALKFPDVKHDFSLNETVAVEPMELVEKFLEGSYQKYVVPGTAEYEDYGESRMLSFDLKIPKKDHVDYSAYSEQDMENELYSVLGRNYYGGPGQWYNKTSYVVKDMGDYFLAHITNRTGYDV